MTGPGQRLLAERLAGPSTDVQEITSRLDAVAFLLAAPALRAALRDSLKSVPDMARPLGRLALDRGGPRDLGAIAGGLLGARALGAMLAAEAGLPPALAAAAARLHQAPQDLAEALQSALADDLPLHKRDGGFIRAGFSTRWRPTTRLRPASRR